jgi:outer membrane receptor for ferrienterochelin and colicins
VEWSASVGPEDLTRQFLRTPNAYGNWVAYWQPKDSPWLFSASAVWTGSMLVPHFAGFVDQDRLERSTAFWEANLRVGYDWDFGKDFCLNLYGGVQNLLNQFQTDLDRGLLRDASYVYGPSRPRTVFVGFQLGRGRE